MPVAWGFVVGGHGVKVALVVLAGEVHRVLLERLPVWEELIMIKWHMLKSLNEDHIQEYMMVQVAHYKKEN